MREIQSREGVIVVAWGFDHVLSPDSLGPLFQRFDVDPSTFWSGLNGPEADSAAGLGGVSDAQSYLNRILACAEDGRRHGRTLTNRLLHEMGSEITLYDGLPGFFGRLRSTFEISEYVSHGITVEHFIVSTGLKEMIVGSKIGPYVKDVFGCEFDSSPTSAEEVIAHSPDAAIRGVRRLVGGPTKPRLILDIARQGTFDRGSGAPLENLLYVAGSASSFEALDAVKRAGGHTLALYGPGDLAHRDLVLQLGIQSRVQEVGEANFTNGSPAAALIEDTISRIAWRLLGSSEASTVGSVPMRVPIPPKPEFPAGGVQARTAVPLRGAVLEARPAPVEDATWSLFSAACRTFLGAEFERREAALRERHDRYVASLADPGLSAFMAELQASIATPGGRQRRSSGPTNSNFEKLLAFLDMLHQKHLANWD